MSDPEAENTQPDERSAAEAEEVVEVAEAAKVVEPDALGGSDRCEKSDDGEAEIAMRRLSRRGFVWMAAAVAGVLGARQWLITRAPDAGVPWPFRRALELNERVARNLFSRSRLAPTFPASVARMPKVNGGIGLEYVLDPDEWRLHVDGEGAPGKAISLLLADIQALPRVEIVTELKCIEGWSVVVHWAGARFADFAEKYCPLVGAGGGRSPYNWEYVGLSTPDGKYYVGMDADSALHPQTLLCYEMNGAPLTDEHGAPVRLVTPVKYGIKHIKRLGSIRFGNARPPDYWAERGYDWYAGH